VPQFLSLRVARARGDGDRWKSLHPSAKLLSWDQSSGWTDKKHHRRAIKWVGRQE
jgi:hypothetical protein